MTARPFRPLPALLGGALLSVALLASAREPGGFRVSAEEKDVLSHLSYVDEGAPTIRITGADLQITSGSGATDGPVNGLGNLILGDHRDDNGRHQLTGSHNVVMGEGHEVYSYGSIAMGWSNTFAAPYTVSFSGAYTHLKGPSAITYRTWMSAAAGDSAKLFGGSETIAMGDGSLVFEGYQNATYGDESVLFGGRWNYASGRGSVGLTSVGANIQGTGSLNWAGSSGTPGVTSHRVAGDTSVLVGGGGFQLVEGDRCVLSGGRNRTLRGTDDWAAGSLKQDD